MEKKRKTISWTTVCRTGHSSQLGNLSVPLLVAWLFDAVLSYLWMHKNRKYICFSIDVTRLDTRNNDDHSYHQKKKKYNKISISLASRNKIARTTIRMCNSFVDLIIFERNTICQFITMTDDSKGGNLWPNQRNVYGWTSTNRKYPKRMSRFMFTTLNVRAHDNRHF